MVLATMAERDALTAERDAALAERDRLRPERDALPARNERPHHKLLKLQRAQFRWKSELLPDKQPRLGLESTEVASAKSAAEAARRDPALRQERIIRRHANLGKLPARVELELAPPRLIEGGLPTETLVAHVLAARCANHLPLHLQAQIVARQGVFLGRSTLGFRVGHAAPGSMPVLDPWRGRARQGCSWAIARDDRPRRGADRGIRPAEASKVPPTSACCPCSHQRPN